LARSRRLEFQVDSFATAQEANVYMQGEAFAENPIGVEFDPEELIAQFSSDVAEAKLLARPEGPGAPIPREHGIGV
jgi:hypothetical protein